LFLGLGIGVSGTGDPSFSHYFTTPVSGSGTYYGAYSGGGTCTLDPTPPVGLQSSIYVTVAVNTNDFLSSEMCGACLNVTGSGQGSGATPIKGSFLAYANNLCPSCAAGGLDMGMSGDGIWDISWFVVPCPAPGNVQYFFQGTGYYYIKLQVRNTVVPVYQLSVEQGGTFVALVPTADGFFASPGSAITFPMTYPMTIQVTSVLGDTFTDSIQAFDNGAAIAGNHQFPGTTAPSSATSGTTTETGKGSTSVSTVSTTTDGKTPDNIINEAFIVHPYWWTQACTCVLVIYMLNS